MDKQFAPHIPKNSEGWWLFPRERSGSERKAIFPEIVMQHHAKLHVGLTRAIIEYVSNPGDVIMDPMGGSGTVMLAALMGRYVTLVEIEPKYHDMEQQVLLWFAVQHDHTVMDRVTLINADSKLILPIPCNHIITSPPYADAFKPSKELSKFVKDKYRAEEEWYGTYAHTQGNVGLVNTFLYNQLMEKLYHLYYQSVLPGGTCTIVTKDTTEKGQRVYLSRWIIKTCLEAGFELHQWYKHELLGGPFQDMRRAKGQATVDDEDLIIFRRPA